MTINIAYVFGTFPAPTQTFAVSDVNALASLGAEVSVFALARGLPAAAQEAGWSGPISYADGMSRKLTRWRPLDWRRLVCGLGLIIPHLITNPVESLIALACLPRAVEVCRSVDSGNVDVVHAFWGRHPALPMLLLDRVPGEGRPLLSIFVGAYDLVYVGFLVRLGLRAADIVFTHSHENRSFFEGRLKPEAGVHVVHRGIPLSLKADQEPARAALSVVTASALTAEKNVAGVLEAFRSFHARYPTSRLEIIGDGPERGTLEALAVELAIADVVTFRGHCKRSEVFAAMEAADIFLFLSRKASERLPNVLKEAIYAGCSVISSPSVGLRELISDDSVGWIVDASDDVAIAKALDEAAEESPTDRRKRQRTNRDLIEQSFSSAASMRRYLETWDACLQNRAQTATVESA